MLRQRQRCREHGNDAIAAQEEHGRVRRRQHLRRSRLWRLARQRQQPRLDTRRYATACFVTALADTSLLDCFPRPFAIVLHASVLDPSHNPNQCIPSCQVRQAESQHHRSIKCDNRVYMKNENRTRSEWEIMAHGKRKRRASPNHVCHPQSLPFYRRYRARQQALGHLSAYTNGALDSLGIFSHFHIYLTINIV